MALKKKNKVHTGATGDKAAFFLSTNLREDTSNIITKLEQICSRGHGDTNPPEYLITSENN